MPLMHPSADNGIRYVWAEIVKSDGALRPGEFASARSSTAAERAFAKAEKKSTCNTFFFRGCGYVMRLIIIRDVRQPGLMARALMEQKLRKAVAMKGAETGEAFPASIFATALALAPQAIEAMRWVRENRRCESCTCIFRNGGPLDRQSPLAAFAQAEVTQHKALKEIRHGA